MNTQKKKVLFFSEAVTLAHVVRPYSLAVALDEQLYDVAFASANRYTYVFNSKKVKRYTISSKSSSVFVDRVDTCKSLYSSEDLIEYVSDDLRVIDDFKPDIIVGDFRHSLSISSRLRGIPYVALINAYWSPYSNFSPLPIPEHRHINLSGIPIIKYLMPTITSIVFKVQARALNGARYHFGQDRFEHCLEGWASGDYVFYYDIPGLVSLRSKPTNHSYIGPVHWSPDIPMPQALRDLSGKEKIVYISMGSSGNASIIPKLVDSLRAIDCEVVVCTTNGALSVECDRDGVYVEPLVPGNEMSRIADLVICNGGSPTAYQALNNGTPVIGIPSNMDQLLAMRNIESVNAGKTLRFRDVGSENFLRELKMAINDGVYDCGAKNIAKEMHRYDGAKMFCQKLAAII